MSSSGATAPEERPGMTIVTEVPESLQKMTLFIAKNFFSKEHYLVVYYIMRNVCIKEEKLRALLYFDQKQLRQLLANLKQDKLVRERLVQHKSEATGRTTSVIFYFINYRAIVNVAKYKIDHMRQRLESKEKEHVQRASYKCTGCPMTFDVIEVDRLIDHATGGLICIHCKSEVIPDEKAGPQESTRSGLARFNDCMQPLFRAIIDLTGVQLAPHLLEPDVARYMDADDEPSRPTTHLDWSGGIGGREGGAEAGGRVAALGGSAHAGHGATMINYANADHITVNLNGEENTWVEPEKETPQWLADNSRQLAEEAASSAAASTPTVVFSGDSFRSPDRRSSTGGETPSRTPRVDLKLLADVEGLHEERKEEQKKESEGEEEGDEEMVNVQGVRVPLSEVTEADVERMTADEKEEYVRLVNQVMDF